MSKREIVPSIRETLDAEVQDTNEYVDDLSSQIEEQLGVDWGDHISEVSYRDVVDVLCTEFPEQAPHTDVCALVTGIKEDMENEWRSYMKAMIQKHIG